MIGKAMILLVEDDPNLGFVTKDNLEENGYEVEWVQDGEEGWHKFNEKEFDMCLLDVMLPKQDGYSLGKQIRAINKDIPILFLTARGMLEDRIKGLELGGDDYIVKPFSMKELMLRMEVFLKRSSNRTTESAKKIFELGELIFTYSDLNLKVSGKEHTLTQKEADLLLLFCQNMNTILKREEILQKLWGDDDYFMGRSLDVFISRLRKYLKESSSVEIMNYHGIGFKFQLKDH